MFPNPQTARKQEKWSAAVKRECRGLLLCARTGKVIARRFHKFFNVGEVTETKPDALEGRKSFEVTTKIDGSLVSPFILPGTNVILWALKSSICSEAGNFASMKSAYNDLARCCIEKDMTPLFEWCECKKPVGVIEYDQSSLTLLAARSMENG